VAGWRGGGGAVDRETFVSIASRCDLNKVKRGGRFLKVGGVDGIGRKTKVEGGLSRENVVGKQPP